ncbi:MAG TPA: VOC family protein [Cellulomonas sp.]
MTTYDGTVAGPAAGAVPLAGGVGVTGIDHVGIAVRDLGAAADLLGSLLDLRCGLVEHSEREEVGELMLAAGGDEAGARVQLLTSQAPLSTIGRFLATSGPGLHHLALRVEDIDRATRVLRDGGTRLLYQDAQVGTAGSRVNFLHPGDTADLLVELVEPARAAGPTGTEAGR